MSKILFVISLLNISAPAHTNEVENTNTESTRHQHILDKHPEIFRQLTEQKLELEDNISRLNQALNQ